MGALTSSLVSPFGRVSWAVLVLAIAWVCGFPRTAYGQRAAENRADEADSSTSPEYDTVLDRAVDAFDAEDYARAREFFEKAYELRPNARVLRGLGISALRLERFSTSKRELKAALRETSKQPLTLTQREGVKELLTWMETNLGSIQLRLSPAHAHVTLDGARTSEDELVVKPGSHRVRATADGFTAQERTVELAAGQEKTLTLKLARAPADEPAPAAEELSASLDDSPVSVTGVAMSAFAGSGTSEPAPSEGRDEETSLLSRWWFWTALGVAIAGGLVATVALASSSPKRDYEPGGLGGVIMPLGRAP